MSLLGDMVKDGTPVTSTDFSTHQRKFYKASLCQYQRHSTLLDQWPLLGSLPSYRRVSNPIETNRKKWTLSSNVNSDQLEIAAAPTIWNVGGGGVI